MSETIEQEPFSEERFRELWESGMRAKDIGAIFGKTKSAITGYRKRLDLPPRLRSPRPRFEQVRMPEPEFGKGISFEEMADNRRACKWPVTLGSPFRFCGAKRKTGAPYCEYHHREAHPPGAA
jgi:hypothetical protein